MNRLTRTHSMHPGCRTPSPTKRSSFQSPPPAPKKSEHPRETVVGQPIPIPNDTFQNAGPRAPKEKKD